MCASVCPSQALWFGTREEFARPGAGALIDDFAVRPPGGAHQGLHGGRRRAGGRSTSSPGADAAPGTTTRSASRTGRRAWTDAERPPTHVAARLPVRPPTARTRSRGASSRATSCSAPAAFAAGSVGVAAWTPLRPINTRRAAGDRRARRRRASATRYLFRYPDRARPGDPRPPRRTASCVAFSQKCTHLGCVVYYEPERAADGTARATKASSTPRTRRASSPARRSGRSAASTSRSATTA